MLGTVLVVLGCVSLSIPYFSTASSIAWWLQGFLDGGVDRGGPPTDLRFILLSELLKTLFFLTVN